MLATSGHSTNISDNARVTLEHEIKLDLFILGTEISFPYVLILSLEYFYRENKLHQQVKFKIKVREYLA